MKIKYRRHCIIDRHVRISKDFKCGKGCVIGPDTKIGINVKIGNGVRVGSRTRIQNTEIGDNSFIEGNVVFTGQGSGIIKIGKESYIGIYNILDWSDNIFIGDYVHVAGPSTGLWTHSSAKKCLNSIPLNNKSKEFRPTAPITIESNVYIGGNSTIYPGITIGHHSIVAPNSAVTKNVDPYSMVGGVPAKVLKKLRISDGEQRTKNRRMG